MARKKRRKKYAREETEPLVRAEHEGVLGYCNEWCRSCRRGSTSCCNIFLYLLIILLSGALTFCLLKRDGPLFGQDKKCAVSNPTNNSPFLNGPATTVVGPATSPSSDSPILRLLFLSSNAFQQGQYALAMYILENFQWFGQPATDVVCLQDFQTSEKSGRCMQKTKLKFVGTLQECKCICARYRCAAFSHMGTQCEVHTSPCIPQPAAQWLTYAIDGLKFLQVNAVNPPTQSSQAAAQTTIQPLQPMSSQAPASTQNPSVLQPSATQNPSVLQPSQPQNPPVLQPSATQNPPILQPSPTQNPPQSSIASSGAPPSSTQGQIPDLNDADLNDVDLDGLDDLTSGGVTPNAQPQATQNAGAQNVAETSQSAATQNPAQSQPVSSQSPQPSEAAPNADNEPIPPLAELGVHRRLLRRSLQEILSGDLAKTSLTFLFDSYWTDKAILPAGPPPEGIPTTIFSLMIKDMSEELRIRVPTEAELKQIQNVFDIDRNSFISFSEFYTPLSPILHRELGLPQEQVQQVQTG